MTENTIRRVLSRFKSESGEVIEGLLDLPIDVTVSNLQRMCNALLKQVRLCIKYCVSAIYRLFILQQ